MELWELAAREDIRDTLARYTWSGDSARLDDLAQTFCEDGELEIRGQDTLCGRTAIVDFLGGVAEPPTSAGAKRIVRHNLTNIRFLELTPQHARVA